MKERILKFLQLENKTSSQFAEEIGVQPSSISHIISGRNNPSLDFILKMLGKYNSLNPDWLLFGNGEMYRGTRMEENEPESETEQEKKMAVQPGLFDKVNIPEETHRISPGVDAGRVQEDSDTASDGRHPHKVILLYRNGRFDEYDPS